MIKAFFQKTNGFPLLIFVIGLIIAKATSWHAYNQDKKYRENTFDRLAQENFSRIVNNIEWHEQKIERLSVFFLASTWVNKDEFNLFTNTILSERNEFDALGWIEASDDLSIVEKDLKEIMREYHLPAPQQKLKKSEHSIFFLSHTKSQSKHKAAIGEILSNNQDFVEMADQTINSGKIQYFLRPMPILGINDPYPQTKTKPHLIMFHPAIYVTPSGKKKVKGLSFSILDIDYFFFGKPSNEPHITDLNIDVKATENNHFFHLIKPEHPPNNNDVYAYSKDIELGKIDMNILFSPNKFYMNGENSYAYIVICLALTSLSAFMSFYFWQLKSHIQMSHAARQSADRANNLKSEFLATMSHEIRSPMTGVLGMAELLQSTKQTQQQARYTNTIINSGEQLLQIIEDILDFSKIEADKIEISPIPINLLELVDEVAALYSAKAREKALEIIVRYVPGTPQFVYADPVRIKQIISNLVLNGIKFTKHGFIAIIIEEDASKTFPAHIANLSFSIVDTGIGIDPEAQLRIFNKFSQADTSTTRQYGGTGLGLAICKRLVEMMDGKLSVTSVPGEGATFHFNLPLKRNIKEVMHKPKSDSITGLRAIIVDDIPIVQTVVKEQLESIGMQCTGATTAADALEKMKNAAQQNMPYDIAIIDYLMPEQDGKELALAIKKNYQIQNTCLVMLSGIGNHFMLEEIKNHHFSAFIMKPLRYRSLIETLVKAWNQYQSGFSDQVIVIEDKTIPAPSDVTLNANILIVEDDIVNQAYSRAILEEMGCIVTTAVNGQDALKTLEKQNNFDLILMDCQMPVMDGFEATRRIMELKHFGKIDKDMKIIALTANAIKGDRERCLDAGMDDYMTKPIRKRDLETAIHKYISEKQEKSPSQQHQDILDTDAVFHSRKIFKENYEEILSAFFRNTEKHIQAIEGALENQDAEAIIIPAHTIKSSSKTMGAIMLAVLADGLEGSIIRSENAAHHYTLSAVEIQDYVIKIKETYTQTKEALTVKAA